MKAIIEALKTLLELPRYLFAVFMVVISWWLADHLGPPDEGPKKLKPGKVDYYSKGLRRTVMDKEGNPKELLFATEMIHYEEKNLTELIKPEISLFVKDGPPWVIRSETATIPSDSEFVFLNGDVLVLRDANKDGRTIRIETTNVRAQPEKDYAETDEDIRVISYPDYMTGTGAKINFGSELKYRVLANVRRKHDVQNESN
ncbi:MAG: LPS export ABC transporter periplasmic protein LptC [Gammaproteobacteria bacterium]|nr:LPS export ABC transporter periplasmic protein LptC [Gammaproteobacteria bacterium]NBT44161.1 LPS export ABC transporter periplasmic protein LptC [Gammaproteobacteria bacterium]NBY22780.1 LPS export ABC transporter periplasmic protein LptC [Gammaproteobacteria bacterium]NDE33944.1 LPS export ABC transporter periplasmic protein LptC [Gammaproteobacteria bacterium]NDE56233.1 LPS export ABC transporter periplasmic protein LptC [Gammaproteobacteria bacterium]